MWKRLLRRRLNTKEKRKPHGVTIHKVKPGNKRSQLKQDFLRVVLHTAWNAATFYTQAFQMSLSGCKGTISCLTSLIRSYAMHREVASPRTSESLELLISIGYPRITWNEHAHRIKELRKSLGLTYTHCYI